MNGYTETLKRVSDLLNSFLSSGYIDTSNLDIFDELIYKAKEDQIIILNHSYLSIEHQRVLFSALYNISQSADIMKNRLTHAHNIGENPTTVELSLELIPQFFNITPYIDQYIDERKLPEEEKLFNFSRSLYKKAKKLGFTKDASSQLKEVDITMSDIKSFTNSFTAHIGAQIEIDEEGSLDENND